MKVRTDEDIEEDILSSINKYLITRRLEEIEKSLRDERRQCESYKAARLYLLQDSCNYADSNFEIWMR